MATSYAGIVDAIWMGVGVIYMIYLYLRHRERIADTGKIFWDDETAVTPSAGGP